MILCLVAERGVCNRYFQNPYMPDIYLKDSRTELDCMGLPWLLLVELRSRKHDADQVSPVS